MYIYSDVYFLNSLITTREVKNIWIFLRKIFNVFLLNFTFLPRSSKFSKLEGSVTFLQQFFFGTPSTKDKHLTS